MKVLVSPGEDAAQPAVLAAHTRQYIAKADGKPKLNGRSSLQSVRKTVLSGPSECCEHR